MGVNTYYVEKVIHISPPSSLEAYFQEVGRAGRSGNQAYASLYYNNSDIASNTHTQAEMRNYCLETGCMRKNILQYFGFDCTSSKNRCCGNCAPVESLAVDFSALATDESDVILPCRTAPCPFTRSLLIEEIQLCLIMVEECFEQSIFFNPPLHKNCAENIINGIEYIRDEYSLLEYGVSEDKHLSLIYQLIDSYCPLL